MRMAMPVSMPVSMPMAAALRRHGSMKRRRQVDDLPVSHPAFGDDVIGEFLHVFTGSLQDRHLHAALMVQVDVKRGLGEIMMIVEVAR